MPEESQQIALRMRQLRQQLQNVLIQKENQKEEQSEVEAALAEIEDKDRDEMYQAVGKLIIKKNKEEIKQDLEDRAEELELHIKSLEKKEKKLNEKVKETQDKLSQMIQAGDFGGMAQ